MFIASRGLIGAALVLTGATVAAGSGHAVPAQQETVPFVVINDTNNTVRDTPFDTNEHANDVVNAMLAAYQASGAEIPEVMSVWTVFPFNDNTIETRFVPIKNDVTGIGLENAFGEGQEVFDSFPPMRAMLIHNDVTVLADRADFQGLPHDGFGEYLFLLELGHLWGPEIHVPASTGLPETALIGFDFHWSFFSDAGGSPIGGNAWLDNGDGTFTAAPFVPSAVTYSPLDLYLMGLAPSSDVAPFGVLHDVTVPPASEARDPFTGRALSAASFPWQGPDDLVVTGERTTLTIDDVIAANGPRVPAFGDAPTSFTLGVALLVPPDVDADTLAQLERDFAPLAANLAPSFARATGDRGSFTVLTSSPAPPPVVVPDDDGDPDDGDPQAHEAAGCAAASSAGAAPLAILGLGLIVRRRRR